MSAPEVALDARDASDAWDRGDARLRKAVRYVAGAGLLLLAVDGLLTVLDVLLRWLLKAPIPGLHDFSTIAIVVSAASCLPATLASRLNVMIRVFSGSLGSRGREALETLGALLTVVVFALIVWKMTAHTIEMKVNGRTLSESTHPIWPYWTIVTALLGLALLVQCWVLAFHARCAILRRTWHDEPDTPDPEGV
ncbi:MAG: TRAP transporter small permease subunit [Burkholderiaceae bacterium]|nr:TRAP transporter small permease subunit [Burkholderiaceae bacterium]